MQVPRDLAVFRVPAGQPGYDVTFGDGGASFTPMLVDPGIDLSHYYLNDHQDEIAKLNTRARVLAAASQALVQVAWLSRVPVEVVDEPMEFRERTQYAQQVGTDAVVYLSPYFGLDESGRHLTLRLNLELFINPHTEAPYAHGHVSFGLDQDVKFLHQDPNKPPKSIYALDPQHATEMWFQDDAVQLRTALDAALPLITNGLITYLDGNGTHKPPQAMK